MLLLFSVFEKTHYIFNPAMDPGDDSLIDELDDELESTLQQVDRRALEGIDPSATDAAQLTVVQPLVQVCPARLSSLLSCVVYISTPKGGGLTGRRPRRSGVAPTTQTARQRRLRSTTPLTKRKRGERFVSNVRPQKRSRCTSSLCSDATSWRRSGSGEDRLCSRNGSCNLR